MDSSDFTISLSLYIRGKYMDPDYVTKLVGLKPDHAHKTGHVRVVKGRQYPPRKDSVWRVSTGIREETVDETVDYFVDRCGPAIACNGTEQTHISRIEGVESCYIDALVQLDQQPVEGSSFFALSASSMNALASFRLPVEFTLMWSVEDGN